MADEEKKFTTQATMGVANGVATLDNGTPMRVAQPPALHVSSHSYGQPDAISPTNIGQYGVAELSPTGTNIADALKDTPNPAKTYSDIASKISSDIGTHAGLPDVHHAKSHAHNGSDGSGTVAHASLTGKTANDHHNQSHNHNGDGSGTVSHSALTDVSADQHHNKSHAHDGADGSGTVSHGSLTGISADQHHAQAHSFDGADHTGSLSESKVAYNPTTGHSHTGVDSKQVSHANLSGVSADQHHAQSHALGGTDHSGTLVESKVAFDNSAGHSHTGTDSKTVDHTNLANKGTNTHANIDSHLGSTSNPHSTTASQVGLGNLTNDAQLKRASGDFNSFTEKTTIVDNDILLMEDSADSFNKKKVKKSTITASSFGGGTSDTASEGESTNATTTYANKLDYTTGSLPAGKYRIGWNYGVKVANAGESQDMAVEVASSEISTCTEKDNFYRQRSGFYYYTLASPGTINIKVKHRVSTGTTGTSYIKEARIEVWRVS